jgi:hypothetical protein
MSDFGFMSAGFGDTDDNAYEENFRINITAMLSLFISKALEDSMKYIKICKRNAVTKHDLEMALKFQTLRFWKNPELENEIAEMKEEIIEELDGEYYSDSSEGVWEDVPEGEAEADEDEEAGGGEDEEAGGGESEEVIECGGDEDDNCVEILSLEDGLGGLLERFTINDEESDDFARANLRETEVSDRNFVVDFHKCSDSWNTWIPENEMQKTLFNAIESMTARF